MESRKHQYSWLINKKEVLTSISKPDIYHYKDRYRWTVCFRDTWKMNTSSKPLLHRMWGWKGSLKNLYCNSLGLKSGSSTTDCPGSYLMRSPRTEKPPPLGNLFQCSTALKLRFSLCWNANSYISFHAHCLLSCEWANWGDVGFLFTPSHSVFINTGKTFKAKQSQLSYLSRTDASCLLSSLQPFITLIYTYSCLSYTWKLFCTRWYLSWIQ